MEIKILKELKMGVYNRLKALSTLSTNFMKHQRKSSVSNPVSLQSDFIEINNRLKQIKRNF